MSISATTAGCDLGYGNVKVVGRRAGAVHEDQCVLPVGASPLELAPKTLNGKPDLCGGELVLVKGAPWVAGADPLMLQGFARQTHEGYIETDEYQALFFAALARLGYSSIDHLVTGLPCSHFFGPKAQDLIKRIRTRFCGEHWIRDGLSVRVKNVYVIAQPAGAFTAYRAENPGVAVHPDSTCLVLDVGFFSVDYVLMMGDSLRHSSSGSSLYASSSVLTEAAQAIERKHKVKLTPSRLESTFRRGQGVLAIGGEEIELRPFMEEASAKAARHVMAELASTLRQEGNALDKVLLTGGGAQWYAQAARAQFGDRKVLMGKDPVLANAKGYQFLAQKAAQRPQAA